MFLRDVPLDFIGDFFQRNYCFNLIAVENVLFVSFFVCLFVCFCCFLLVITIDVCLFVVTVVLYPGLQNIERLDMSGGKSL